MGLIVAFTCSLTKTKVRQMSGVRLIVSGSDRSMLHSPGSRSQKFVQARVGSASSVEVNRGGALGRAASASAWTGVISRPGLRTKKITVMISVAGVTRLDLVWVLTHPGEACPMPH